MRAAHLSDLHYCDKHMAEADRCMAFTVDRLQHAHVDLIVMSIHSSHRGSET